MWAHAVRAHVALYRGDQPGAEAALSAGEAELAERGPLVRGTDWLLWARARLLERQGDVPAAAALLGAVWDGHAARGIVAERCLLGPDLVRLARGVGDHDRVAAVVVGVDEAARRAQCGSARGAALRASAQEEVVSLAVRGLTNREIGRRLFVSPRTVETHLSHVFTKLGVASASSWPPPPPTAPPRADSSV